MRMTEIERRFESIEERILNLEKNKQGQNSKVRLEPISDTSTIQRTGVGVGVEFSEDKTCSPLGENKKLGRRSLKEESGNLLNSVGSKQLKELKSGSSPDSSAKIKKKEVKDGN